MSELEPGIVTDLRDRLTYGGYLRLDTLLDAQQPLSGAGDRPARHDEMLFIIQHQVAELWMKLMIHELRAAIAHVRGDALEPSFKILARVKLIQKQLFEQWAVLETLTPSEYEGFRPALGTSSGFQSAQYRAIEFLLGNKNAAILDVFRHDAVDVRRARRCCCIRRRCTTNSCAISRVAACPFPARHSSATSRNRTNAIRTWCRCSSRIYEDPAHWWDAYDMCEKLIDVEEAFQLWRFRHMKTVERIIGFKTGTGGSSGVAFLRRALEHSFFPELIDVRTVIGAR